MTSENLLSRLEKQCSRCEYCSYDIRTKAFRLLSTDAVKNGQELHSEEIAKVAESVLDSLISEGYVDDFRYASAFAREKAGITGWGPVKIRFALKSKKIDGDIIERAMDEINPSSACSKLLKLMESKWKTLEGDPQGRLKLIRFALGRGYDYDTVSHLLPEVISLRK